MSPEPLTRDHMGRFYLPQHVAQARKYRPDARYVRAPHWVIRITSGMDALVYGALMEFYSQSTGEMWPKVATLADLLNTSARTVQRALNLLEERTLIKREGTGGRSRSNRYRLVHHPADPDYEVVWTSEPKYWGLYDTADYALRGYGEPRTWTDDVHAMCAGLRAELRRWYLDKPIDVPMVVRAMDTAAESLCTERLTGAHRPVPVMPPSKAPEMVERYIQIVAPVTTKGRHTVTLSGP